MSREYHHARWNDQNWRDDGHCLRRASIPFFDTRIGAAVSYWPYDPHGPKATGSIDYSIDKRFGAYNLYGHVSHCLRDFHGEKCVPAMKEYIDRFITDQYPLICRWYYDEVYYFIQRDTDPKDYRYKKNLDPEDLERAREYLETVLQAVITVEKGPAPVKRSGQLTLSAEA